MLLCCVLISLYINTYMHLMSYADDWRADGYRWKQNGNSYIPNREKVYKKIHFSINTGAGLSSAFQKFVFIKLTGDEQHVVVHYVGND